MKLETITPPSGEPLSLADAKAFARIGSAHEDALIASLIETARARIEAMTGLALLSRTLRLSVERWPAGVLDRNTLRLPKRPGLRLLSVYRVNDGEVLDDLTSGFAFEAGMIPRLVPRQSLPWSQTPDEAIRIEWQAGFGTVDDVPEDLVHALKLIVAHEYENRDATDYRAQDQLKDRLKAFIHPWQEVQI